MDILACLQDQEQWRTFLNTKIDSGHLSCKDAASLNRYIEENGYESAVRKVLNGEAPSPPRRVAISKMHSDKKRIVYIHDTPERNVLKFLTFLLQRKYDRLFAPNLYSFRPGRSVRSAVEDLKQVPGLEKMWSYKVDISNYFNSVPIDKLLPALEAALPDDPAVYRFLAALLTDPRVIQDGKMVEETEKGIMAGTPVSTFLANLYLAELDWEFAGAGKLYARYSDDIITFAKTEAELADNIRLIHKTLEKAGLTVNPRKESRTAPGEPWVFLGFRFRNGEIDVAPASVEKLKAKMRRKTRALARWRDRKGASGENAASAFIKTFNRKLFENPIDHELTWARWYFPMITTTESLREIDRYCQDCIRYLVTGKRTKAAYNCRYEDMKKLGYVSLVNRYYSHAHSLENLEETVD